MTEPLDLMGPEEMADHGIVAEKLWAGDRLHHYQGFEPSFYIASRFEDVSDILLDTKRFLSGQGQGPNFVPAAGVVSDAPQHTFFRRLVQDDFKPDAIAQLEPRLRQISGELLDAVEDKQVWDIHDDFSFPLPVTIICEIFGIPTEDIQQFKIWSDASVAALSAQDPTIYIEELARMNDYVLDQLHEKRSDLGDASLLARVARARRDGVAISDEEAVSLILQLFVAGNETTTSLITNFMWRMLRQEGLWAEFCAGSIDIDAAINESLRFDPPLLGLFRTTACEVEIGGTTVPAGTKVMIHYAAANRDPTVFDRPNVFDPKRPVQKIMSFGLGTHFCLGGELAKLEARVMLGILRERFPQLELVDDGERIGPFLFWGKRKLPVRNKV